MIVLHEVVAASCPARNHSLGNCTLHTVRIQGRGMVIEQTVCPSKDRKQETLRCTHDILVKYVARPASPPPIHLCCVVIYPFSITQTEQTARAGPMLHVTLYGSFGKGFWKAAAEVVFVHRPVTAAHVPSPSAFCKATQCHLGAGTSLQ